MRIPCEIPLDILGLGLILYSPKFTNEIPEGSDFLGERYWNPDDVSRMVRKGSIVGFCTGSPGIYFVKFMFGILDESMEQKYKFRISLGIEIVDEKFCVRDLYDLSKWTAKCPDEQIVEIGNGFYHLSLYSNPPQSGIIGDRQEIHVYVNKEQSMPKLTWEGVPMLCE